MHDLDGDGKHDGRVPLGRDLRHGLQRPELHGRRCGHRRGGLRELDRRLQLAVGGDDLGPSISFRFGLTAHRPLDLLGQIEVPQLDATDLDSPVLGLTVERDLQLTVDLVTRRQQFVQLVVADDGPQGGLGHEPGRLVPVLHLHHRGHRVDDPQEGHGIEGEGDVVLRDHLLGLHRYRDLLQVDLHDLVQDRDDEEHAGPLGADAPAEAKDHSPLVLLHDLQRGGEHDQREDRDDDHDGDGHLHGRASLL